MLPGVGAARLAPPPAPPRLGPPCLAPQAGQAGPLTGQEGLPIQSEAENHMIEEELLKDSNDEDFLTDFANFLESDNFDETMDKIESGQLKPENLQVWRGQMGPSSRKEQMESLSGKAQLSSAKSELGRQPQQLDADLQIESGNLKPEQPRSRSRAVQPGSAAGQRRLIQLV